jgi:hypothetical protein
MSTNYMVNQKSKIVILNSLSSRFFIIFNSPLLIALYLIFYQPEGFMIAIYIIGGIWLSFMITINKVQMFRNSVIIEPWLSVILHLGFKTRIEKSRINNVEYLPGASLTGEMVLKYTDDKKIKEAYVGMTENGTEDIKILKKFFRIKK